MVAFASTTEKGHIYINSLLYEKYNIDKLIYHETLESEIVHNKEIKNIAKTAVEIIKNDDYIKNNNFIKIYTKKGESDFNEGIQYSDVADSSINNSITNSNEDVNITNI